MKLMDLFKSHAGWVSGVALVVFGVLGVLLGKLDHASALSDVVAGLGLLGLHLAE